METLKKLANLFPGSDKVLHFIAGAIVAFIALLITDHNWAGFSASLFVGGVKEFYDSWTKKAQGIHPFLDWGSTMLGGLFIELIY